MLMIRTADLSFKIGTNKINRLHIPELDDTRTQTFPGRLHQPEIFNESFNESVKGKNFEGAVIHGERFLGYLEYQVIKLRGLLSHAMNSPS